MFFCRTANLKTVIPGCVACGKTRHRAPPSEQLALSASDKLNPPSSTAAETRQPSFPAPSLPNERHFVGLTAWGVSQLEDELREGHWLAFTTESNGSFGRVLTLRSDDYTPFLIFRRICRGPHRVDKFRD